MSTSNNNLPKLSQRLAKKRSELLLQDPRHNVLKLPNICVNNQLSYRGISILNEAEKKETMGYKIKSLLGALPNEQDEKYISILQDRGKGLYTGEDKNDLVRLQSDDRQDISSGIKLCLRKRSPLGAAKSNKWEFEEPPFRGKSGEFITFHLIVSIATPYQEAKLASLKKKKSKVNNSLTSSYTNSNSPRRIVRA